MIMKLGISTLLLVILLLGYSCNQQEEIKQPRNSGKEKESMVRINQYLVSKDEEIIANYVKRRGWNMDVTKTGLWYMIYQKGDGKPVRKDTRITIEYSVSLLDGTLCYHSDESGPKQFVVGKGEVEPGLDEGIRLLQLGDKARFILPPHLAYGLLGDENKIPARSVIVYDLTVLSVDD
jgi:FKBP-type peptidyl-prolyl cis-trans isomerase FkpA